MPRVYIEGDPYIALYNADKREVIAVFESFALAQKYLFPKFNHLKKGKVHKAFMTKRRILGSIFEFPVAVRRASDAQVADLLGNKYCIYNEYPIPPYFSMKGFTDTKGSLKQKSMEKLDNYAKKKRVENIIKINNSYADNIEGAEV